MSVITTTIISTTFIQMRKTLMSLSLGFCDASLGAVALESQTNLALRASWVCHCYISSRESCPTESAPALPCIAGPSLSTWRLLDLKTCICNNRILWHKLESLIGSRAWCLQHATSRASIPSGWIFQSAHAGKPLTEQKGQRRP